MRLSPTLTGRRKRTLNIAEILASANGRQSSDDKPRPLPEAQIAELRSVFAHYANCPFKVGDLITPRANGTSKWAGEPHLVLEVRVPCEPHFSIADPDDGGSPNFGRRFDVRVGVLGGDSETICAYWQESWNFVPYEPKQD